MASDQLLNFIKVGVSTTYDAVATSIVLVGGEGAELPDPAEGNYNLVWWDSTTYSDPADDPNAEIVRVTALSTDTLTVTRGVEGSGNTTKNTAVVAYKMFLGPTTKTVTDVDTSQRINQASHGFVVGDVLRHNGTIYVKAQADSAANGEVIGIVSVISSDGDYFSLSTVGYITGLSGLTAGEAHFLSDATAGLITATAPTTEGSTVKPILVADSTTSGYIYNMRGFDVTAGSTSFYQNFDSGDDTGGGIYPINHGLGHKFCITQVYDNNDILIVPDDVTLVDNDNLTLDLNTYTVSGTWRIVVLDTGNTTAITNREVLSFTSASPQYSAGTVTHTHDLGDQYVQVQIYDNNDQLVQPTNVTATSTSVSTIDLIAWHPITGTWKSVAQK